MSMRQIARGLSLLLVVSVMLVGCKKATPVAPPPPDYARELPPGAFALRKITNPADLPDLQAAFRARDKTLAMALDRSIAWFNIPSTKQFYPSNGISHEHARQSLIAFREVLLSTQSAAEFQRAVYAQFDCYTSVGWNDKGVVFFTGYYSPIFQASRTQQGEFQYPLYRRPADLVSDPITGEVKGRRSGSGYAPYPTRAQIEQMGPAAVGLAGHELVWLRNKLDAYIVQVNGSARLNMTDGSVMHIGYAGNNGYEYTSIGKLLVADGKIDKNRLSLPVIRAYFQQHPDELDKYILRNDRFVFFQEYPPASWPAGSLGFPVTPWRSLATDKSIYPRGNVTLVDTDTPSPSGGMHMFSQFMMDQDTGGAIRAAGRADIYMGVGPSAEQLAGRQAAEGRLYYFFLKTPPAGQ
ncbi:MAG: MltA domain-containing protein [Phycisphaeraceae bacterium]|nr:MltA domain-containing protein [Phycisphaeraceae bacterium]